MIVTAGCVPTIYVPAKKSISINPFGFPLGSITYPSGLTVLVERDTRTSLAGVFLVVGVGASSDPVGKEGLAHLVEHLTFRSRSQGGTEFSGLLRQAGSILENAQTNLDSTVYYEVGALAALPELLETEGHRMLSAIEQIPEDVRATELEVVKSELRLRNETGYVGNVIGALQGMVFPAGHAYARPVIGTRDSLATIGPADVAEFVRTNYRPGNMTLLILGDVDSALAERMVAGTLPPALLDTSLSSQRTPRMMKVPPPLPHTPAAPATLTSQEAAIDAPELWLAWALPRGFDNNRYLLTLSALAVQFYLADRAPEKEVLATEVEVIPGVMASLLVCHLRLRSAERADEIRRRVIGGIDKLFWHLSANLRDFSRAAMVRKLVSAEDLAARGIERATISHFSLDPSLYSRTFKQLADLDLAQVGNEFGQYITEDRARAVLVLPPAGGTPQVATAEGDSAAPVSRGAWPAGVGVDHEEARRRDLAPAASSRRSFRLPNGLSVILEERPGLPVVTAALSFPAVPSNRREAVAAEAARTASFASAVMNGQPAFYGAHAWSEYDFDRTAYFIYGGAGNADQMIAFLAESARSRAVSRSSWSTGLDSKRLEKMKKRAEEPHMAALLNLARALFATQPWWSPVTVEDLKTAERADAQAWLVRTHQPANATLVVAGDLDADALTKAITQAFEPWVVRAAPPPALTSPEAPAPSANELRLEVTSRPAATQAEWIFGCLLPQATTPGAALRHDLTARILQTRLIRVLREERGATYSVSVNPVVRQGGTSFLELATAVDNARLDQALDLFDSELRSLAKSPPTAEELAAARVSWAGDAALARMTNLSVVRHALADFRKGTSAADDEAALGAVAVKEISADLSACLSGNPVLELVGDEAVLAAAVKRFKEKAKASSEASAARASR